MKEHKLTLSVILLIILLLMSLTGCSKVIVRPVYLPLPVKPVLPEVRFQASQTGVILDSRNARALAEREIMIRAYIEKLESPWYLRTAGSAAIGGIEYIVNKNVRFSLNYQDWYPYAKHIANQSFIFCNLMVKI